MKKKILVTLMAAAMTVCMSIPAFAGQWLSDASGWWWQNNDGSYPANTWQWIDGNNDGIAECYYFNENGYCLMNTTTPDGNLVNPVGAWIVDGVIQQQAVSADSDSSSSKVSKSTGTNSNYAEKNSSWVNLWRENPERTNRATKSESGTMADGETEIQNVWIVRSYRDNSFDLSFDGYIIFENKGYEYLTVSFAPEKNFSKTGVATFKIKVEDDLSVSVSDWNDVEDVDFMWDDGIQSITADVGGWDYVLVGTHSNDADAATLIYDMYLHD